MFKMIKKACNATGRFIKNLPIIFLKALGIIPAILAGVGRGIFSLIVDKTPEHMGNFWEIALLPVLIGLKIAILTNPAFPIVLAVGVTAAVFTGIPMVRNLGTSIYRLLFDKKPAYTVPPITQDNNYNYSNKLGSEHLSSLALAIQTGCDTTNSVLNSLGVYKDKWYKTEEPGSMTDAAINAVDGAPGALSAFLRATRAKFSWK